jgi:hypothetical protein
MQLALTAALGLALSWAVAAQIPVDVTRLGPQPGEAVPDFSLPDQDGAVRTMRSLLGPKGAMLVFSRSADW